MHSLKLVYDFGQTHPMISISGIVFCILGIGVFIYHKYFVDPEEEGKLGMSNRTYGMVFGAGFALFAGSMVLTEMSPVYYFDTKKIYHSNQMKTVEGIVENYHPMPAYGHDTERFDVNGVHFEFSDFMDVYGYNNAAALGGVIRPGLYVRIHYYTKGNGPLNNTILKLETE